MLMQRTRTLERVRYCCANPKSFVNMIFKKGSSSPSKRTMIMLKMIAIENIFRMSLMYLNINKDELRSTMRICAKNGEESAKLHEDHMENILAGFIPPTEDYEFTSCPNAILVDKPRLGIRKCILISFNTKRILESVNTDGWNWFFFLGH